MKEYLELMPLLKEGYTKAVSDVYTNYRLTAAEFDVLMFLANNPEYTRAVDIVERRGIVKSQVSLSINSLVAKGYLQRVQDDKDHRSVHVYVCERAKDIIQEGREAQAFFTDQLLRDLGCEEQERMRRDIKRLVENLKVFLGGNM